jgi:NTE family protein
VRVGLVLGAGGVQGGAWLTGGLDALAETTGWDPATAEIVVGTSAGALIGSLCVAGIPPWFMVAHSAGETFDGVVDARGRPAAEADRSGGAQFRLERALPPIGPGSWRLAFQTLRAPHRFPPAALFAGWAPRGFLSTEPLKEIVRSTIPEGWTDHPNHWVVACDYATGRRVAFGRADAPPTDLADAVAASCAIPGFYHPVSIDGRRYVDGGIYSTSNLDLVGDDGLDLVICLNPTSSLHPTRAWNPADRVARVLRDASGRRLGSEAKKLRARGAEVVLIQPTGEDLEAMGPNLMSRKDRNPVIATARRTVAAQLDRRENRDLLTGLPRGDERRVRRPPGEPSTWPDLREIRALIRERTAG